MKLFFIIACFVVLAYVDAQFLDGRVAQTGSVIGNFNFGKKKRSTEVAESLSKRFLDGHVGQNAENIFNSNGKKKRSTEVAESLSKRFLDGVVIQNGNIVNLTKSINLTDVTKSFADGKVAQKAGMIGNFNLGKKKRTPEVAESLPKRFLDGNVAQNAENIFNSNGKKKRSTEVAESLPKRFLDGNVAQNAKTIFNSNGKKKRSTEAVKSLSKRFLDGTVIQNGRIVKLNGLPVQPVQLTPVVQQTLRIQPNSIISVQPQSQVNGILTGPVQIQPNDQALSQTFIHGFFNL